MGVVGDVLFAKPKVVGVFEGGGATPTTQPPKGRDCLLGNGWIGIAVLPIAGIFKILNFCYIFIFKYLELFGFHLISLASCVVF